MLLFQTIADGLDIPLNSPFCNLMFKGKISLANPFSLQEAVK